MTGLAAGAGARSLMGLRELFQRELAKQRTATRPAVVEVNVPEVKEEEEELPVRRLHRGLKFAQEAAPVSRSTLSHILPFLSPEWWKGNHTNDMMSKPWFLPAATAATLGGMYGGYKVMDKGLGLIRKNDKKQELEDVKNEYRRALIEQYTADSPSIKRSEEQSELGKDLDELYTLTKEGLFDDAWGKGMGAYLTLAGLLAGGTGVAAYNWTKSRSPDERLAKAIKQRERLRWATRPPEIYAVANSVPARISRNTNQYSPGTEEDENTVRKISSDIASFYKP